MVLRFGTLQLEDPYIIIDLLDIRLYLISSYIIIAVILYYPTTI